MCEARLTKLVRSRLGAEVVDCELVEQSVIERDFIVLWRRGGGYRPEHGTHRAMLDKRDPSGDGDDLVWGHYMRRAGEAHADYEARVRSYEARLKEVK